MLIYFLALTLLLVWVLGYFFTKSFHQAARKEPFLSTSLAIFLCLCVLQLAASKIGFLSALASLVPYNTYLRLPYVLVNIFIFFLLFDVLRSEKNIYHFMNGVFVLIAAAAIYAFFQKIAVIPKIENLKFFINPNHFSFLLNLIFPFAFISMLHNLITIITLKSQRRSLGRFSVNFLILGTAGTIIIGAALVWLNSKGAIASAGIMILLITLIYLFLIKNKTKKTVIILIVTLLFLACLFGGMSHLIGKNVFLNRINVSYFDTLSAAQGKFEEARLFFRPSIILDSIDVIKERPFLGTGICTFYAVYPAYQTALIKSGPRITHAHNDYLELLFETGFLGFFFLLIVPIGIALKRLFFLTKNRKEISLDSWVLLLGVLGGMLTAGLHSAITFALKSPPHMFVFLGLAASFFSLPHILLPKDKCSEARCLSYFSAGRILSFLLLFFIVTFGLFTTAKRVFRDFFSQRINLNENILFFDMDSSVNLLLKNFSKEMRNKNISIQTANASAQKILDLSQTSHTYRKIGKAYFRNSRLRSNGQIFIETSIRYLKKAHSASPLNKYVLRDLVLAQLTLMDEKDKLWRPSDEEIQEILPYIQKEKKMRIPRRIIEGIKNRNLRKIIKSYYDN